jgi:hypothetical protein
VVNVNSRRRTGEEISRWVFMNSAGSLAPAPVLHSVSSTENNETSWRLPHFCVSTDRCAGRHHRTGFVSGLSWSVHVFLSLPAEECQLKTGLDMHTVSVVIPNYNHARFLRRRIIDLPSARADEIRELQISGKDAVRMNGKTSLENDTARISPRPAGLLLFGTLECHKCVRVRRGYLHSSP